MRVSANCLRFPTGWGQEVSVLSPSGVPSRPKVICDVWKSTSSDDLRWGME